MSNDLYQRQLEKAQKRLEHSSNCLAGPTKDRNAAVLSKKARKKLYKEYCNGVQREHNKKLNNGLPILHKVPPK